MLLSVTKIETRTTNPRRKPPARAPPALYPLAVTAAEGRPRTSLAWTTQQGAPRQGARQGVRHGQEEQVKIKEEPSPGLLDFFEVNRLDRLNKVREHHADEPEPPIRVDGTYGITSNGLPSPNKKRR